MVFGVKGEVFEGVKCINGKGFGMSGHSKWATIKRKKGATDAKRAKIFTKIGREIAVAVRAGGGDPDTNSKLRDVVAKARANNMPNDNVTRCIKKAEGSGDGANYEEITYEGYGPKGVAVIVETMTDNKNRTAADVRHAFDKCGGNLGQSGCVSYLFDHVGVIMIETEGIDEDALAEDALECGIEDIDFSEGLCEIKTTIKDFGNVCAELEGKGYTFADAEIAFAPQTYTALSDERDITFMNKLIEMLEDNDDVQNIWHNWEE